VNIPLAIFNGAIMYFFMTPLLYELASRSKAQGFGPIVLTVLILDFTTYIWHRANHTLRFLWRFHRVHHSDMNFDTSTALRFHIGEILISFGFRYLVVFLFRLPLLGLVAFELLFSFFNFFEHGNLKLPIQLELVLEKIFITPGLHRKHHSQNLIELNSNYGTIFSFWDRLARTRLSATSQENFKVGLPNQKSLWTLTKIILNPFQEQK
jgi:sterol desaturase/sphingolipid hydroxylase (fatty acid hydroxylase superfamily)